MSEQRHSEPDAARPTIIYDGECSFCRRQVARIQRWSREGAFAYLTSQTPDLLERYPQLAQHNLGSGLRLVETDGAAFVGADAIYHITRRLPRWRWISWIYRVPGIRAVAVRLYAAIAARRHRM